MNGLTLLPRERVLAADDESGCADLKPAAAVLVVRPCTVADDQRRSIASVSEKALPSAAANVVLTGESGNITSL